jgi:flagellar biosynthesis/type III secretory pathway protein FliH
MSTVIKSGTSTETVQRIAFNLEDISQRAEGYVEQVRLKAAQIVVEAQKQAEVIRRKAEQEGKEAAMRAVEHVLDEKVGKRMETLLPALAQVVSDLADARQIWLQHWERAAVRLGCAIAERITRQRIERTPEITIELAREALQMAAGSSHVVIQLNPADVESLGSHVDRLVKEFGGIATAKVVGDAAIAPGGCRVETRHGAIDQQFSAQLARIEADLTSGNDK